MNALDFIAACIVGVFLITVAVKGRNAQLIVLAKRDIAFVKWAVALGILYYLYSVPAMKQAAGLLIAAGFLGFFLLNIDQIKKSLTEINTFFG